VAAAVWVLPRVPLSPAIDWVRAQGMWAPVVFVALYVGCTVLMIPGSLLSLAAGSIFGVLWGSLYAVVAANLGANAAFLLGRWVAREAVGKRVAARPGFAAIDEAVGREGWKIVGLLRLSPVVPFTLLNYALGVTRVSFGQHALASLVGMLPGTVMYVFLGSAAGLAAGAGGEKTTAEKALFAVGLAATVAVTLVLVRLARRALAAKLPPPDPIGHGR
jgi:uncharacterized membrane protein YdjX (TVP38/TMEM64 family)